MCNRVVDHVFCDVSKTRCIRHTLSVYLLLRQRICVTLVTFQYYFVRSWWVFCDGKFEIVLKVSAELRKRKREEQDRAGFTRFCIDTPFACTINKQYYSYGIRLLNSTQRTILHSDYVDYHVEHLHTVSYMSYFSHRKPHSSVLPTYPIRCFTPKDTFTIQYLSQ